ncbi:MAG: hypothetical protein AB7O24_01110 [Kofleriaceae bacterium]
MGGRGPRRLSDVASIAHQNGCELVSAGGGKHNWRFVKAGKRPYTVPAHNGLKTEISWKYIQGLCRNLDIPIEAFTDD